MISVDTMFASPSATRPVSGATLTNNIKCVRKNIQNCILLPSFVLSFIHSYIYICIDPLLQIRCFRCGMNSYHKIAYEQFNRNWRDSLLSTSYLKTENTIRNCNAILVLDDVRDRKRCYIVYMQQRRIDIRKLDVRPSTEKERSLPSIYVHEDFV